MIQLTGANLNERHKEFNTKVNEAVKNNVDFNEIKSLPESSDVDKLFKIALASKHKNIDYILEVLKSGDSLYISKALKCDWIFDDEFAHIINPQFIEKELFPEMSLKMTKKLITTISSRLRNKDRAEEFYHLCIRNKMNNVGMDFLLQTNESFKMDVLRFHSEVCNHFDGDEPYLEQFVGNSFLIAELYLSIISDSKKSLALYKLRYLYSVSSEKYLDLLETTPLEHYIYFTSLKLSQTIMKKHKQRVLKTPKLYLQLVNEEVVKRYSTSDDAKIYAVSFLPDTCDQFWDSFYFRYGFLKLIPLGERFLFIKRIFTQKYPGEKFEEGYRFYTVSYYDMMSDEEKENWALSHVASGEEQHGCGNDYVWYRFVNFQLAFTELKKYILITPDKDKRSEILNVLAESAKTREELITLMEYYYIRHVNELKAFKRSFINKIIENHNVLNFDVSCWASLEKIFYSLKVYHKLNQDYDDYLNDQYRTLSLIYHIIHEKPVPDVLREFLLLGNITVDATRGNYNHYMQPKHVELIFQYLLSFFANIVILLIKTNTEQNQKQICDLIHNRILNVISKFDKKFEDIPEVIRGYILKNLKLFECHPVLAVLDIFNKEPPKFGIRNVMHFLKRDSALVVSNFPTIKSYIQRVRRKHNLNWLVKKLKIYFHNDIAPEIVKLLNDCLTDDDLHLHTAQVAVYGILNLADDNFKVDFLNKYTPRDSKIDHVKICRKLLKVQTAICSTACLLRPPLPHHTIREYTKGDYFKFYMPVFDNYMANLKPQQRLSFLNSLIDNPVSIKKHVIRMAFRCFTPQNLRILIQKIWKNTKNVSIRKIIYKALFDKINYYHDDISAQWELFGALNIMTLDLNEDDDEEVFSLLCSTLPPKVMGQHLHSAYIVLNTFPKKKINYRRLAQITRALKNNLQHISGHIVSLIMEDHINTILENDDILNQNRFKLEHDLINEKWSLIKTVIIEHVDLHTLNLITDKVLAKWYITNGFRYVYQVLYTDLLRDLESLSYNQPIDRFLHINCIFQTILERMELALPHIEIHITVLRLKLNIIARHVFAENGTLIEGTDYPQGEKATKSVHKFRVLQIIFKFCYQVRDLMTEHLKNKKYFVSFTRVITQLVRDVVMEFQIKLDHLFEYKIKAVDIEVYLCSILSEGNEREFDMFVVDLLPQNYDGEYCNEYNEVINTIKSKGDTEIKYFLCHKFYNSDYKHKKCMP